jgi:hypothetical protein
VQPFDKCHYELLLVPDFSLINHLLCAVEFTLNVVQVFVLDPNLGVSTVILVHKSFDLELMLLLQFTFTRQAEISVHWMSEQHVTQIDS